ncbi:MAG: DNA starvation/stationary phase protection protein [Pelatocladus maniniholoensis HA4357-MV3]|jgi:starvation-inducible DNA-binding protein|uniref:DNA starvation/stationary phase protection protein n=1 Tax=Pelatocladus maniniholoensis HA4357-MV3 TaxID=1117104 RepID=A0A9E3H392_9NOST|nr:DNA starvation/stationary phase protection protein [Pelatocladus maniniholoensis HA4357-MV3]
MPTPNINKLARANGSQPLLHQHGHEIQPYGNLVNPPITLSPDTRRESCTLINQILADTIILYHFYKKHHWMMRGHTFYQLHLLLDKHASEQIELIDVMAERVQTLGGVAIADPRHVAEVTKIKRPPNGVEEVPVMLSRLLEAHELIITELRSAIDKTAANQDSGTNDMLVSQVLRTNELQVWFLAEHLVDTPLVRS